MALDDNAAKSTNISEVETGSRWINVSSVRSYVFFFYFIFYFMLHITLAYSHM